MPLINKDSFKSFAGGKSYLVADTAPAGFAEAVKQAENIVFQYTGIAIPEDIINAIPQLQFYAHCILQYIVSGQQDGLSEHELQRRKDMYDTAMASLEKIEQGKLEVKDSTGAVVSAKSTSSFYYNDGEFTNGATLLPRSERL